MMQLLLLDGFAVSVCASVCVCKVMRAALPIHVQAQLCVHTSVCTCCLLFGVGFGAGSKLQTSEAPNCCAWNHTNLTSSFWAPNCVRVHTDLI
eukprot:scaffold98446_cov18-Tisochrysis_lutea.AAC.2